MTDTIFALSSGGPPSAIAVVRISGPRAHQVLEQIAGDVPGPRLLALRSLRDPKDGVRLDRALVAQFPSEGSVTGEPLVELHLHGGRATIKAVQEALARMPDVRPAKAGEFTWRSFQNGKLDLLQVESLSDLLRAETEAQRRAALAGDQLSGQVDDCRVRLLKLSAHAEAMLDQSDEDDVPAERAEIELVSAGLAEEIGHLLERPDAERLFDGVRVVFAGPPNSGKSTLINALVGREVAITSPIAGTTRDVIEAPVQLGGVAFVLTDTAGLREGSKDEIERIGIDRANRRIAEADLVVWMDDVAASGVPEDKLVRIFPRADELGRERPSGEMLAVSALTGEGMGDLVAQLVIRAANLLPREGEAALSRRQRQYLQECHEHLVLFRTEPDELLAAEQLRLCRQALDELTGRAGTEDMLDALFGTFCIGK